VEGRRNGQQDAALDAMILYQFNRAIDGTFVT
jgi:hypothetical protein